MRFALVLTVVLASAAPAFAQSLYERGAEAYADGRFADAERLLEQAAVATPADAEVHYLLARIRYDARNPGRDEGAAGEAIEDAIDLDPTNQVYLVAHLEQLRGDTWNFLQELARERRRREVARRLLAIDSTNAYAHEELGVQAISEYYQFRNAIAMPGLQFRSEGVRIEEDAIDESRDLVGEYGPVGVARIENSPGAPVQAEKGPFVTNADGEDIADRFDVEALRRRGVVVTDYRDRAEAAYLVAVGHLQAALENDPRRRDVYDHVVRLATLSGRFEDVLPALAQMYVYFPDDAEMWLYTGLANHRMGQYEAAAVAFDAALARMDDRTRTAYTDLTLILPPEDWSDFRAAPEVYAERYWTSRDPRFLNAVNERRTEHYARLTTSELLYRSDDLDIPGWNTERGRLHVRYGVPQTDVIIDGGFGRVVSQFAERAEGFSGDPDAAAGIDVSNRFNVWDYGDGVRFVFEDPGRNGQFRLYSPPADVFALVSARNPSAMDFVERAQEEVRRRPERYQFQAPGRSVQLPYRVTAFKGEAGRTDLYVNYGIPVGESGERREGTQEDVNVTVKTGAFLIGPQRDLLVERRRTVYGLRGAQIVPFDETRLWTSTEPMTAVPGDGYEVSLEFETASGQTSAVQRRRIDVPSFGGDALQLSDILLAYFVEEEDRPQPGRVFRDGVSVQAAPWGVFRAGDPIYLYVEAYQLGLNAGQSDYEVEASLRPKDTAQGLRRLARRVFGSRGAAVSSAFEGGGDRADEPIYLFLDAGGQDPGLYTLTVTVRDRVTGAEAERDTDLLLE